MDPQLLGRGTGIAEVIEMSQQCRRVRRLMPLVVPEKVPDVLDETIGIRNTRTPDLLENDQVPLLIDVDDSMV